MLENNTALRRRSPAQNKYVTVCASSHLRREEAACQGLGFLLHLFHFSPWQTASLQKHIKDSCS